MIFKYLRLANLLRNEKQERRLYREEVYIEKYKSNIIISYGIHDTFENNLARVLLKI